MAVTNTATDVARDTTTNDLGYYTVGLLTPGNYVIAAEKSGFRTLERTGIVLQVDQHAALDFTMEVGQLTQTISVQAGAPLVDSTEASVGQVITNTQVVQMPLKGRNYVNPGIALGRHGRAYRGQPGSRFQFRWAARLGEQLSARCRRQ